MNNKHRRHTGLWILLIVLMLLGGLGYVGFKQYKSIKSSAYSMKSDAKELISSIGSGKMENASSAADRLAESTAQLLENLNQPFFKALGYVPVVGSDVQSAERLVEILDEAIEIVLQPTVDFLSRTDISSLKSGGGLDSAVLDDCMAFYQQLSPALEKVTAEVGEVNLNVVDPDGTINGYLDAVGRLSGVLGIITEDIITPLRQQVADCPLDDIKVDGGFNVVVLSSYLDFLEELIPDCRRLNTALTELNLGELDSKGLVADVCDAMSSVLDLYDNSHEYFDLVRAFIGDGSDRVFLVAAQNSAELYASGGFPGSVGTIRITDGYLKLDGFNAVKYMLGGAYYGDARATEEETSLFPCLNSYAWDAGYCPDFSRVAKVWAASYGSMHREEPAAVISLTPAVVGQLISAMGGFELSDGTVLDAENTVAYLQYVIYARYKNSYSSELKYDSQVNSIFEEVADKAMDKLVSEIDIGSISKYIEIFENGVADRTIMCWFADEEKQQIARNAGMTGELGHDPENPQIGLFYSTVTASKLGWWMDIDYELSEPVINSDGSRSYVFTARFGNALDRETASGFSTYIIGNERGSIDAHRIVVGPAGGSITEVSCDRDNTKVNCSTYQGLPILTCRGNEPCSSTLSISCIVTTAPGVDKVPEVIMTPTLTKYRLAYEASQK